MVSPDFRRHKENAYGVTRFPAHTDFIYSHKENAYGVTRFPASYGVTRFPAWCHQISGVHPLFGENIPVRLRGVDTPEIRAKCPAEKQMAVDAREQVKRLLAKAEHITLKETGRDKYFRIVARVVVDGVDLGEVLIREGLAVPYEGGRKEDVWCGGR